MFRFFENLSDPFAPYRRETPPNTYLAFMIAHLKPMRGIMAGVIVVGLVVALFETGLI